MLRTSLRKILGSAVFWGTSVLFAAIMVLGAFSDIAAAVNNPIPILYCFIVTSTVGIAHVLMPVISIIPFTFFYVDELDKKSVYYNLIRCSKRKYYFSNIFSALISSALVTVTALALFVIVCIIFGASLDTTPAFLSFFGGGTFYSWLEAGNSLGVMVLHFGAFILFSLPWGLVSLVVSLYTNNRYVIIAAPFILSMAFSYITEMAALDFLNPGYMLLKGPLRQELWGGFFHALIYQLLCVLLLSGFYYFKSKRRYLYAGL